MEECKEAKVIPFPLTEESLEYFEKTIENLVKAMVLIFDEDEKENEDV